MDELENEFVEQDTDIETDNQTDDLSDVQEVDTDEQDTQDSSQDEQEDALNPEQVETPAEKIKVGDKEYTQSELAELLSKQEEPKKEEYQPRQIEVIETEIKRATEDFQAEALSLAKKYISRAEDVTDANGNVQYTAEQLFQYGMQSGDWQHFINSLSPQDAVIFEKDRVKIASEYQSKFENLSKEKGYIEATTAKQNDLSKWDSFIETNFKDKVAEKYVFDYLKKGFDFDEKGVSDIAKIIREAVELEKNQAKLSNDNQNAKNSMMNSSINGGKSFEGTQKIFTVAEIEKMSSAEYEKHEKIIDEQYAKGLIK